jgi:hypothetical protein
LKLLAFLISGVILSRKPVKSQAFVRVFHHLAGSKMKGILQFSVPEQFGVIFRKSGKLMLKFQMRGDTFASLPPLFGSFEQKFSDLAAPQTLNQIIKRAVFESSLTATILFAARQILFDIGRAQ